MEKIRKKRKNQKPIIIIKVVLMKNQVQKVNLKKVKMMKKVKKARTVVDGHIVEEVVVVANDHILIDDAERAYHVAVAELCLGIYDC